MPHQQVIFAFDLGVSMVNGSGVAFDRIQVEGVGGQQRRHSQHQRRPGRRWTDRVGGKFSRRDI